MPFVCRECQKSLLVCCNSILKWRMCEQKHPLHSRGERRFANAHLWCDATRPKGIARRTDRGNNTIKIIILLLPHYSLMRTDIVAFVCPGRPIKLASCMENPIQNFLSEIKFTNKIESPQRVWRRWRHHTSDTDFTDCDRTRWWYSNALILLAHACAMSRLAVIRECFKFNLPIRFDSLYVSTRTLEHEHERM